MTAQAERKKENVEIQRTEPANGTAVAVNATDDLFERFTNLTRDIAERAYSFFRDRGGEFGKDLDDWIRAESEMLRPVPIEMTQTDDTITVKAAVAGFKPEEIEVSVKDNVLIINGISVASAENKDGDTVLREWNSNRFCRQLMLPDEVVAAEVNAELADGMLKVTMPKAPPREAETIVVKPA
jgi:HSP20 family protein